MTFDRTKIEISTIKKLSTTDTMSIDGTVLEILNCYAIAEYVSSPFLRNYFAQIERQPIIYNYDDIEVTVKNLNQGNTNLRLDNIRG